MTRRLAALLVVGLAALVALPHGAHAARKKRYRAGGADKGKDGRGKAGGSGSGSGKGKGGGGQDRDLKNQYCGMEDCYDVLGLDKGATHREIKKKYRALSRRLHPDKFQAPEGASKKRARRLKKRAQDRFADVAKAYEVLGNKETRAEYDYCLYNPDAGFYCRYRRIRMSMSSGRASTPAVLLGFVAFVSVVQFFQQRGAHRRTLTWLRTKHEGIKTEARKRATERLRRHGSSGGSDGGGSGVKSGGGGGGGKKKSAHTRNRDKHAGALSKKDKDALAKLVEEETEKLVDEFRAAGGAPSPTVRALLGVRVALAPYSALAFAWGHASWFWRFTVLKKAYGPDEWGYLTRTALGYSDKKWAMLGAEERARLVAEELWVDGNLAAFEEREREAHRKKNPGRYKRELRQRKKGGGGYRDVLEYQDNYGLVFEQ